MQTIVIGHRNPDMDSICSALAYARLKQALGWTDVVAGRAGNLNARIQFVLEKFGVEPPVFLSDVTPQVRDVMTRGVVSARADQSVAQALRSIEERRLRMLPVVDEAGRCLGLLSAITLLEQFFPPRPQMETTRVVRASVHDIVQTFDGMVAAGTFEPVPPTPWPSRRIGDDVLYPVPVDDFELGRFEIGAEAHDISSAGPQLLLGTAGRVVARGGDADVELAPGHAAFVPAGRPVLLTGSGTVFRATVGSRVVR